MTTTPARASSRERAFGGVALAVLLALVASPLWATPPPGPEDEVASDQQARRAYQEALYLETAFGDYLGAIEIYRRILRDHRSVVEVAAAGQIRIGACYRKLGRWRQAIEAYEDAVTRFSSRPAVMDEARAAQRACLAAQELDRQRQRLAQLGTELHSADARVRVRVLGEAGDTGDPELLPAVLDCLSDPDVRVRIAALRAVERLGDRGVIERVYQLARDPSAEVRQVAVEVAYALTERDDSEESPEAIFVGLESGNPDRRYRSIELLRRMPAQELVPLLIERVADPNPRIRHYAVILLGNAGGDKAVPVLRESLQDPYVKIRLNAALALWKLGDGSGHQAALAALGHGEPQIRFDAARILSHLGDPAGTATLLQALDDDQRYQRVEAIAALARLFDGETLGYDPDADAQARQSARDRWAERLQQR